MARFINQGSFKDGNGSVVSGGTVSIFLAGTTTAADVYEASSGGVAVTSVTSATNGHYYFYVDENDYASTQKFKIVLSKTGYQSATYDDIQLYFTVTGTITDGSITLPKIEDIAANSIIARDANSSGVLSEVALATTQILIGNGAGFTSAALSGDVTMDNAGAVTIGTDKVTTVKILDSNVTADKLAADSVTTVKVLDDNITPAKLSQKITTMSSQATTSGTSIDFTGIPSWVTKITVMLSGVSTDNTSPLLVQVGSGSVSQTGYLTGSYVNLGEQTATTGFLIGTSVATSVGDTCSGTLILTNMGNNAWTGVGGMVLRTNRLASAGGISPVLGGNLDRIRLTTLAGTPAFDAGSVNVMYE